MHENRHFICSTDVAGYAPALVGSAPAILSYPRVIERLKALVGRDVASLFAEPVLPPGAEPHGAAISWYGAHEGAVAELDAIDEIARRPLARKLSARLEALSPALRDREIGPIVATWLNLASPANILSVGGEPVLVNWGFLPRGLAGDLAQLAAHFGRTLGRFAPKMATPPVEAPALGAAGAPEHEPDSASLSAPQGFENAAASRARPLAAGGNAPASGNEGAKAAAARPWLAPLVAAAIAALALLVLHLPGVLVYPSGGRSPRDRLEEEQLRSSNESLEAQLNVLQAAAADRVCRQGDPVMAPAPGLPQGDQPNAPIPQMELVPRPPDRVPFSSSDSGARGSENIAELLDHATVLVLGETAEGASQGTGFFISDRHILTNHHVVEKMLEGRIFVTSRAIGGIRRAGVVAKTLPPPSESGDPRVDLAVLAIEPATNVSSLQLGVSPAKLSTVYVAGFPGFITERDLNFKNFLQKLNDSLRQGEIDETLLRQPVTAPSSDLKYGRVNNTMNTGANALPIILHDMQLAHGNSGGPLVDACGRLGGVNTFLFPSDMASQQANAAQDVALVRKFLTQNNIAFRSDDSRCEPAAAQPAPPAGGGATSPSQSPPPQPSPR